MSRSSSREHIKVSPRNITPRTRARAQIGNVNWKYDIDLDKSRSKKAIDITPRRGGETTPRDVSKKNENMLDLTAKRVEPNGKPVEKIVLSKKHIAMLDGYTEVNRNNWAKIPLNTQIRYLRTDGKFRGGGFLKNIWTSNAGKHTGKQVMELQSGYGYKLSKWVVVMDDVEKIWKKGGSGETGVVEQKNIGDVSRLKEEVKYLRTMVDQFKIDLVKLNNKQVRTIELVKAIASRK